MPDRPKPPKPFQRWLDYVLTYPFKGELRTAFDHAREEFAEVEQKADLVDLVHQALHAMDEGKDVDIDEWAKQVEDVRNATT